MTPPRPILRSPQTGSIALRVRLADVATVQAGYVERQGSTDHPESTLRVVRARDLARDGSINWTSLRLCEPIRDPARFLVQQGDVLLTTRTTQIRATVVDEPPPNVAASAQFAILRPDAARVDPHYLAWVLDRAHATGQLRSLIKGSTVQFLSVPELGAFEIPLPPMAQQRVIARISNLRARERTLLERLDQLHDRVLDASLARKSNHATKP